MKHIETFTLILFALLCISSAQAAGLSGFSFQAVGSITYASFKVRMYVYSWNFNEYDAQTIASHFDMSQSWFATGTNDYTAKMNTVKSLNPNYKALMYHDVWGIDSSDPDWNLAKANGWLLKDASGNYVTDKTYPTLYPVDITNASYQQWVAALIKSHLDTYPYFDGVMADNGLRISALEWQSWNTVNPPINPRTGVPFTDAEILNGYLALYTAIKNAIGSRILYVNGIWNGVSFFDNYNNFVGFLANSLMNGPMSEGCWYQGSQWMSEADWLKSLNFVVWMQGNWLQGHPERFFGTTCGAGPQWTMPSGATHEQMMLYGFCSTMLGINYPLQNSMDFSFNGAQSPVPANLLQLEKNLHDLDMGQPLTNYYKIISTSVYARDFVEGKVLVNPTPTSYTVPLNETYTSFYDNSIVTSSITVPADTGLVLLK